MALYGDDFITQKYLRRYPDSRRAKSWCGKMVHIQTENGVWRAGGSGYTYAGKPDAWVLPFEDAVKQIAHCGPEKCGKFLAVGPAVITLPWRIEVLNADGSHHSYVPRFGSGEISAERALACLNETLDHARFSVRVVY